MIELGDPLPDLGTDVFDETGAPADGGAVSVAISKDGVVLASGGAVSVGGTAISVAHPGIGQYSASYTPVVTGQIEAKWTVTGAYAGVQTVVYTVETPVNGIVGLGDAKDFLKIYRTNDDELLSQLILEASDLCESSEGSGLTWRRTVVTDEQHTANGRAVYLHRSPVASLTAVTIDGVSQSLSSFTFLSTGKLIGNGYSASEGTMLVSYVAGGGAIPAAIRGGTLEMVRYLYGTHRGGSGLPRQEEPDYTTVSGYLIPNRVKMAWRSHSSIGF